MTRDFTNFTTLMVQGCTSDAGKSVMVAGICRVLARRGVQVAPFKPQNMALNSAVTEDGGEIGRAQALQAQACYLPARTDFNPVLLKPSSDTGAQVIIHGQAIGAMQATEFHDYKKVAMNAVLQSHQRLQNTYSAIVVEGAGSPAEINLRNGDIANMGFAEAVDCPVVLIADIDRGGVFAHLVGTLALLSESEQARVVGFIINRFRGDVSILQPGLDWLEAKTNKPVLGVVPFLTNLYLDAEDAISSTQTEMADDGLADNMPLKVVVPVVSRISNHTDFDALRLNPSVDLQFVPINQTPPAADLIILPGSKSVISDLRSLKSNDWDAHLKRHLRYGGKLIGICGGYQMLGHTISDPSGVESDQPADHESGFGLLNIQTKLAPHKQLKQVQGQFINLGNAPARFQGYEIHCGTTTSDAEPMLQFENGETAGSISPDQLILGCYIHGLFDTPSACDALLNWAGAQHGNAVDLDVIREQQLNRLADCLEETLPATFWSKFAGSGNLRQDTA